MKNQQTTFAGICEDTADLSFAQLQEKAVAMQSIAAQPLRVKDRRRLDWERTRLERRANSIRPGRQLLTQDYVLDDAMLTEVLCDPGAAFVQSAFT